MRLDRVLLIALFGLAGQALFGQTLTMFETHLAAGKVALQQSRYAEADRLLRMAIQDTETLDESDPATPGHLAEALETLCDLDLLTGKYEEAIAFEERAVAALEKPLGVEHHDLVPHLIRLAGAYRAGSRTPSAIPVLARAIALDIRALGPDDAKVSADYDSLASANMEVKDLIEARKAYEQALQTRLNRLGPDHLDVATNYLNLALLEERDMKPKVARADYEKALAISEKKLGDESYSLTGILDRLGLMLRREKNYGEAEPVLQRSLSIREKTLGSRHSDVAPALDNLALTYFYDNKFVEAEPLFTRSLQIWLATQGQNSPLVAQALDNLGALYSAQQKFDQAEPLFKRALSIREKQDVESLANLALIYQAKNDAKNADVFFQRAILIGEKSLGADNIEMSETLEEYATFLRATGRMAEAKKISARILELKAQEQKTPEPKK
jgi:tetratricopeptide (TPR) repeat protein